MSTPRVLDATATRDGRQWLVSIPELEAKGHARTVREIHAAATEAAVSSLGADATAVEVSLRVHVNEQAELLWEEATQVEAEARKRVQQAAALRRRAIRIAREDGYTLDAIGAAFSISHQRAQQLATPTTPPS